MEIIGVTISVVGLLTYLLGPPDPPSKIPHKDPHDHFESLVRFPIIP